MQIYNADLDIDLLEFSDRFGNIRSTAGCSLKGKVEFDARIKLLGELLKNYQDETIGAVYLCDREFAHHCDRALQLNGIDPDWVNEAILINLLFLYKRSPGLLIQLNRGQRAALKDTASHKGRGQRAGEKEATYYDLLAGLYAHTQDLEQAMRLAEDKPWKEVMGAIANTKVASSKSQVASKKSDVSRSDRNMLALMNARAKSKG
jgi:hypothetical protein